MPSDIVVDQIGVMTSLEHGKILMRANDGSMIDEVGRSDQILEYSLSEPIAA